MVGYFGLKIVWSLREVTHSDQGALGETQFFSRGGMVKTLETIRPTFLPSFIMYSSSPASHTLERTTLLSCGIVLDGDPMIILFSDYCAESCIGKRTHPYEFIDNPKENATQSLSFISSRRLLQCHPWRHFKVECWLFFLEYWEESCL